MLEYFTRAYSTKIHVPDQPLFEVEQKRGTIFLPPELCTMVGIPAKIRENKRTMADIRQSLFQSPNERIQSIQGLSKTISNSKEAKEWDLQISFEPDQIEAKILKRPNIVDPYDLTSKAGKSLNDTSVLRTIVH